MFLFSYIIYSTCARGDVSKRTVAEILKNVFVHQCARKRKWRGIDWNRLVQWKRNSSYIQINWKHDYYYYSVKDNYSKRTRTIRIMQNALNPNYINVRVANLKTEYLQIDFIENALLPYDWKTFNLLIIMYIFLLFTVGTCFNLNAWTGIFTF